MNTNLGRFVLISLFIMYLAIFCLQNYSATRIKIFLWDLDISLNVIVLIALIAGVVLRDLIRKR